MPNSMVDKCREAVDLLNKLGTIRAVADHLGKSPTTIAHRLKRAKQMGIWAGGHRNVRSAGHSSGPPPEGTSEMDTPGGRVLNVVGPRIRTIDDALAHAKIDEAIWYVDRSSINKWEVIRKGDTEPTELFQVKLWLKRRVSEIQEHAVGALIERMAKHAPQYNPRKYPKRKDPFALEFSPFDAHFGKLAWGRETGDNYDLKIAERVFSNALEHTLHYLPNPADCELFIFPVGNDFFHIDNLEGSTTQGTQQDTDGRFAKIYTAGQMACVTAIDRMLQLAPVRVVWVPGNHDWLSSYHLANFLDAWYRNCDEVTVDKGPSPRKYVEYGISLVGYSHGNEEKHASLPAIMATEVPQEWARTSTHEWHLGHQHIRRAVKHTSVDSHDGVTVRTLPSLSGRDAWHHKKGYVGTRAAESYIWSKRSGYAGHISAPVIQ